MRAENLIMRFYERRGARPSTELPAGAKRTCLVALLALLSACGSFAEDPGKPTTLATIHGQVINPEQQTAPTNFRVALVWSGSEYNVANELSVVPQFPAQFQLEITDLPPEVAMHSSADNPNTPPGFRFAYGAVVGYEDLNGNQRLDLISANAAEFVDRVDATNPERLVFFADGTDEGFLLAAQQLGVTVPRGFSLVKPATDPSVSSTPVFFPITEPYDLLLSSDPHLNELMCQTTPPSGGPGSGGGPVMEGRPDVYPSPTDPKLTCTPDGSEYMYEISCVTIQEGPCAGTSTTCEYEFWRRPDPVPADWPCP